MLNQVIRNRRETPTKKKMHEASGYAPRKVWSTRNNRYVNFWVFGIHVLRFENTDPINSKWIEWDKEQINISMLESILMMNVDPDTLKPIDELFRVHHLRMSQPELGIA
jgi:hypothetical protein